jgi:hypothetical protein
MKKLDLSGQQFGELKVVAAAAKRGGASIG